MKRELDKHEFEALCWQSAKQYFSAMDKTHIVRMIEHSIHNTYADTKEP